MPEEHVKTSFYKFELSQQTGKDVNMTKPQSHENATHVITLLQNKPLLT